MKGPSRIILAPGRYFNAEPIVLDDRDSGLTITGKESGAVAEVYGGVQVTGWEKWKGDIWRAKVPVGVRFFNLVVDGRIATMAQTPNAGSGYGTPKTGGWDFDDAQLFSWLGGNWFSSMGPVTGVDAKGRISAQLGNGRFPPNGRQFVRGVLAFLDEPGEWCLKHKEGFVYYWPKSSTPVDHVIVRTVSPDSRNMHFISHTCGGILNVIEDFIEIGVDVLQIDQQDNMGIDELARRYAGRICFFCPVDIQTTLPVGSFEQIETKAKHLIKAFGSQGGGFMAKPIPNRKRSRSPRRIRNSCATFLRSAGATH